MPELTLMRPNERINKYANYVILIDDEQITQLKNNSRQTVHVDAQKIYLKAKIRRCGSRRQKIDFSNNEHAIVKISAKPTINRIMILTVIGVIIVTIFALIYGQTGFIQFFEGVLAPMLILYPILAITLNKNDWLNITLKEK